MLWREAGRSFEGHEGTTRLARTTRRHYYPYFPGVVFVALVGPVASSIPQSQASVEMIITSYCVWLVVTFSRARRNDDGFRGWRLSAQRGTEGAYFWWGALDGEEEGGTLTRRRSFEFLFAVLVRADRF